MALIRQGLADMMNIEARVAITSVFMSLGQAQALCGNLEEALMTTEQGLDANPDELIYRPLLLNLRGDLQLQLEQSELAKKDFREAISLSQKMSAKALELRATTSLARLLRDGGRRDEARSMLSAIYNWFTEGFDTADLKDAKGLLDELTA
jgi:tetratricopeptide (TPR) repeat protein